MEKGAASRQSMLSSESPLHVRPTHSFTKLEADCCINTDPEAVERMVNDPENYMLLIVELNESTVLRCSSVDRSLLIFVLADGVSRIA